jgi:hypothetical protein
MKRRTAIAILATMCAGSVFALYDPKPDEVLSAVQGEWKGSLTYRDYGKADRLVTLPTRLFVALSAPNELVFHYAFDDGPSKTVFSYERMNFDFNNNQLSWSSGTAEKSLSTFQITSNISEGGTRRLTFEGRNGEKTDRYTMVLSPRELRLAKDEVGVNGTPLFRNKYDFSRSGA